jgi:Family of unknown function (DUF6194)
MTDPTLPTGPDPEAIVQYLTTTYPETDVVEAMHAWFFSLDPEKHVPNYATLVTTDEHDDASDLDRPGVFRLNIGVDKATFERYVDPDVTPDHTAIDVVLPHPVYAAQRYLAILNPSEATWREVVIPLLAVAHDRLAAQRARHGQGPADPA